MSDAAGDALAPVTLIAPVTPIAPAAPVARERGAALRRPLSGPAPSIRPGLRPSAARAAAAARLVNGAGPAGTEGGGASPATHPDHTEQPDALRLVEPVKLTPAQRRRRTRALLLAAATVAVAVALGLVYFHVVLAQRQFALNRLDSNVQNERATYERLRLQVAQLGSPQHIISTAVGQLGMRQPASVVYLTPTAATVSPTGQHPDPPSGAAAGEAPAGDADWPLIKSQLAGSP